MTHCSENEFADALDRFFALEQFLHSLEMLQAKLVFGVTNHAARTVKITTKNKIIPILWKNILSLKLDQHINKNEINDFISKCIKTVPFSGNLERKGPPQKSEKPNLIINVQRALTEARNYLNNYPPSLDKTLTYFHKSLSRSPSEEGYVLLKNNLTTEETRDPKLSQLIDASSSRSRGHESVDNIARYRFLQTFAPSKGQAEMEEIVEFFRRSLNEIERMDLGEADESQLYPGAYPVGELLWLISLAPNLARHLRPEIRRAIDKVVQEQARNGWWAKRLPSDGMPHEHSSAVKAAWGEKVSDPAGTALCAVALQKLGDDRHIAAASKAARWLATMQDPIGFWSITLPDGDSQPHVHTSILAAEAILRAGLEDAARDVTRAEQWIISQQDSIGLWFQKNHDPEALSFFVCEYFRNQNKFRPLPHGHLTIAKGFLRRAEELALESSPDAARLSLISAFHGVEMFLYGIAADDRYSFEIFEKAGNTIGLREAMTRLKNRLREIGALEATSDLRWAHQMKMIASLRDQIVHKGHEVTQITARQHVDHASAFVAQYGEDLLNLQVIDK